MCRCEKNKIVVLLCEESADFNQGGGTPSVGAIKNGTSLFERHGVQITIAAPVYEDQFKGTFSLTIGWLVPNNEP